MNYFAGILTVLIVLNCVVLILLVLVQLPKKDAGAGLAFGGGAADALFGAGSGNALTKITKYAVVIFFVLALSLGYAEERLHRGDTRSFEKALQQQQSQPPMAPAPAPGTAPAAAPSTSAMPLTTPSTAPAAAPVAPAGTNSPAK